MSNDRPPQTVGQALSDGWDWFRVTCRMCHRVGRLTFNDHERDTKLAVLVRRAICQRCGSRQVNVALVHATYRYKEVGVEGDTIIRLALH